MNESIGRVFSFAKQTVPDESALDNKPVVGGRLPKALMIRCADSYVVPKQIPQADPLAPPNQLRLAADEQPMQAAM